MRLIWFRNDLRLSDNPALRHGCASDEPVAALFIVSPTQWQAHKLAPVRQRFMLAQVDAMGRELAALGIPLHLLRVETFAEVPAALASLCRELGVTRLYANQAIELDEQRRDHGVTAALAEQEVSCHWLNGCCVLPPGRVLTGSREMFKVFTPFSRAWLKALEEDGFVIHRAPAPRGEPLPWLPLAEREWVDDGLGELTADTRWPVGEAEASRRLHAFLDQAVLDYGETRDFPQEAIWHLPGPSWDGVLGMDVLNLAREAIGLSISTEESHASLHYKGVRPSGIYSVDGSLSPDQYKQLKKWIEAENAGAENAGSVMLLDRNAKFMTNAMTGVDAQHLETRRNQIEEVCRFFRVLPIMIGYSDKAATFASSEAFFSAHLKHTLAPWHTAWTQRIDEMLLDGAGPLYAEFDTRYLTAGSLKDRSQWARSMVEAGIYTRNEIRDDEGLDPLDGLDDPLTPMNMNGANDGTQNDPPPGA